jgi:hypothetical protein
MHFPLLQLDHALSLYRQKTMDAASVLLFPASGCSMNKGNPKVAFVIRHDRTGSLRPL